MKPLLGLAATLLIGFVASEVQGEITVIEQRLWSGPLLDSMFEQREPDYEERGTGDRSNRWATGVTSPVLTVYRPDEPTGAACLVFPGGGYGGHAIDKEGHFVAKWLAERGVVGVVVPYRCGGGKHRHPAPLMDGQRAVRVIRSHAAEFGIDPAKIGVMGFSAGGHLAATVATRRWPNVTLAEDNIPTQVSARPDFAVLVYPVISMRDALTHGGSRSNLIGKEPSEHLIAETSADERVTAGTPPTLLIHSVDDRAVPVENSQRFYEACRANGVPVEMHLYETGGHGYGMWADKGSVAGWPAVLEGWLRGRGLIGIE